MYEGMIFQERRKFIEKIIIFSDITVDREPLHHKSHQTWRLGKAIMLVLGGISEAFDRVKFLADYLCIKVL